MPPRAPAGVGPGGSAAPIRLRRLRDQPSIRELVAESGPPGAHLVRPLFVGPPGPGPDARELPALVRRDVRGTAGEAERLYRSGVRAFLLFGVPSRKEPSGRGAWDPRGPVPRALRAIRERCPGAALLADVCACEYTSHGHCGVVRDGRVDNDATLPLLARAAAAYAQAGADLVAPSAMMDHQVEAIRAALDREGHSGVGILSYAAKFASGLYGPFRDAAGSAPAFGDRRGYQMDPRNRREALRELREDVREGADALLVKPALPYLDVLAAARAEFDLPLGAYQVSGEYAMLRAAASRGWVEEAAAVDESLTAIRRAGADFVITYFAGATAKGAPPGP